MQFYVTIAERLAKQDRTLEYGVGNGRIALPLARHGFGVVGIDQSLEMLTDLKERLAHEPRDVQKRVTLHHGDMRTHRLRETFALVLCPFNAALHLYAREDVEEFFESVHAHVAPGGWFVADISVPQFGDLMRDPNRAWSVPRFRHPSDGRVVKNREYFDYDPIRQILYVSSEFEPVGDPDGSWAVPLTHRQFFPQEWLALLHYNGFDVEKVEGDFHGGPLDRQSDVMVTYCRARKKR